MTAKTRNQSRTILRTQTFNVSSAKTYLGRLIEKAGRGEPIYIVSRGRRFILQEMPEIDPIPMRPEGYFASAYTKDDNELLNEFAKASVICPPDDLA